MWPVRARRGTRKRCAAIFIVGVCAAVMVLTRPFVTAPVNNVEDSLPPLPLVSTNISAALGEPQPMGGPAALPSPPPPASAPLQGLALSDNATANASQHDSQVAPSSTSERAKTMAASSESTNKSVEGSDVPPRDNGSAIVKTGSPEVEDIPSSSEKLPQTVVVVVATKTTTQQPPNPVVPNASPMQAAGGNPSDVPVVYVITPTFPRMEQIPELTRLGQTLMHVPKLFWVVAEDSTKKSAEVEELLRHTGLPYTYILGAMPEAYRKKKGSKPKGVANRMAGLQWIRDNAQNNGVMFFADDDNSYDIRLFEEMRYTKKVSMWPVGLVTQLGISTPVVRNGTVVDFYDGWISTRVFPVDMAGFAVNVGFLKSHPNATMPFKAGFEEDGFLKSLNITKSDIEPKADNCTKIYVWHTKTVANKTPKKMTDKDRKKFNNTNLFSLPNIV